MKKNLLLFGFGICCLTQLLAQDPINRLGIQLDYGLNRRSYDDFYNDTMEEEGTSRTTYFNPQFRLPLSSNLNGSIGVGISNYKSVDTRPNGSETMNTEKLFGPTLQLTRYCDPCESEEDCDRYFTFMTLDMSMLSGKREYEYSLGNFSNHEHGKVRSLSAGISGGVAYRILPHVYLQGSVNILNVSGSKVTWDNNQPDNFTRNRYLDFFSGGNAGVVIPF